MTQVDQFPQSIAETLPGPIERAEDWLVAECERILGNGVFKSVEAGPGEWSDDYLKRIIQQVPAVRVAFLGGEARDNNDLDLDSQWVIYIVTGWRGQREEPRRRQAGSGVGAWRAAALLAPWLHNCTVGGNVGQVEVQRITNLWTGQIDRKGIAVVSMTLSVPLHFDAQIDCDAFDEYLTTGLDWSVTDEEDD